MKRKQNAQCRRVKKQNIQVTIYPKTARHGGKTTGNKRSQVSRHGGQMGGFLNCYDFAYADKDVVKQVGKIAPDIIN